MQPDGIGRAFSVTFLLIATWEMIAFLKSLVVVRYPRLASPGIARFSSPVLGYRWSSCRVDPV